MIGTRLAGHPMAVCHRQTTCPISYGLGCDHSPLGVWAAVPLLITLDASTTKPHCNVWLVLNLTIDVKSVCKSVMIQSRYKPLALADNNKRRSPPVQLMLSIRPRSPVLAHCFPTSEAISIIGTHIDALSYKIKHIRNLLRGR